MAPSTPEHVPYWIVLHPTKHTRRREIGHWAVVSAFIVLVATLTFPSLCDKVIRYDSSTSADGGHIHRSTSSQEKRYREEYTSHTSSRSSSDSSDPEPTARELAQQLLQELDSRDVVLTTGQIFKALPSILPQVDALGLDAAEFEDEIKGLLAGRAGLSQKIAEHSGGLSAQRKVTRVSRRDMDDTGRYVKENKAWLATDSKQASHGLKLDEEKRFPLHDRHYLESIPTPEMHGFGTPTGIPLSKEGEVITQENADALPEEVDGQAAEIARRGEEGEELDGQQLFQMWKKANRRQRTVNKDFDLVVGGDELLRVHATTYKRSGPAPSTGTDVTVVPLVAASFDAVGESALVLIQAFNGDTGELRRMFAEAVIDSIPGRQKYLWNVSESDVRLFSIQDNDISVYLNTTSIAHRPEPTSTPLAFTTGCNFTRTLSEQPQNTTFSTPCVRIQWDLLDSIGRGEIGTTELVEAVNADLMSKTKSHIMGTQSEFGRRAGAVLGNVLSVARSAYSISGAPVKDQQRGDSEFPLLPNNNTPSNPTMTSTGLPTTSSSLHTTNAVGPTAVPQQTLPPSITTPATSSPSSGKPEGPNAGECFKRGVDFFGFDVKKIETGEIRTPGECAEHCKFFDGCFYWTFNPARRWCYLKNAYAPEGLYSDATATKDLISGLKNCDMLPDPYPSEPCYLVGMDILTTNTGYSRVVTSSSSALQCHAECTMDPSCFYWTFNSYQRACFLKGRDLVDVTSEPQAGNQRRTSTTDGLISGAKRCKTSQAINSHARRLMEVDHSELSEGWSDCAFEEGALYPEPEDILLRTRTADGSGCHTRCVKHVAVASSNLEAPAEDHSDVVNERDSCVFWRHDQETGVCLLMNRHAWTSWRPHERDPHSNPEVETDKRITVGSRRCRQFSPIFPPQSPLDLCYQSGIEFNLSENHVVHEETDVYSPQQCDLLCAAEPGCTSWTYNFKTRRCFLLASDAHSTKRVAGESSEDPTGQEEVVVSALFGARHCVGAFSSQLGEPVHTSDRSPAAGPPGESKEETSLAEADQADSGERSHPVTEQLPACAKNGFMYEGHDLDIGSENPSTLPRAHDCWRKCFRTQLCFFWTYDKNAAKCSLKDVNAATASRFTRRKSLVSGPRFCPNLGTSNRPPMINRRLTLSGGDDAPSLLPSLKFASPFFWPGGAIAELLGTFSMNETGGGRAIKGTLPLSNHRNGQGSARGNLLNGLPSGLIANSTENQTKESGVSSLLSSWLPFSGFRMGTGGGFLARDENTREKKMAGKSPKAIREDVSDQDNSVKHTTEQRASRKTAPEPTSSLLPSSEKQLSSVSVDAEEQNKHILRMGSDGFENDADAINESTRTKYEDHSTRAQEGTRIETRVSQTDAQPPNTVKGNVHPHTNANITHDAEANIAITRHTSASGQRFPCEREGVALTGGDFFAAGDPGAATGTAQGVVMQSPQQCAAYCAASMGCSFWTMDRESGLCYLKTPAALSSYRRDATTKNFVSGSVTAGSDCLL